MSTRCYRGSCHVNDAVVIAAVVISTMCYRGSCDINDVLSQQLSCQRCVIAAVVMSTMCYRGSCHVNDVLSWQLSHQRCVIAAVVTLTMYDRWSSPQPEVGAGGVAGCFPCTAQQQRVGVPMAGSPTTCRHGAAYTAPHTCTITCYYLAAPITER